MRIIELDASGWTDALDFYRALKVALGSCAGHGDSPAAWVDSMIWGGMNAIEAPYIVRITGTAHCNEELKSEIVLLAEVIKEARTWRFHHKGEDIDVSLVAPELSNPRRSN